MPHKLLLADDSVTIQRIVELTFADEDIEVITVGDGRQAIDRIERDRPDIVLADVGMAERDGYDVAAFVKGHPAMGHVAVLLLAGPFEPVDEARARAIGCDGVLIKPFDPPVVIDGVRDVLAGRRPESLWPTPPTAPMPLPATAAPPEAPVVRISAPAPAAEVAPVRAARVPVADAAPARVARSARSRPARPEPTRAARALTRPPAEETAPVPSPELVDLALAREPAAPRDEEADARLNDYLDQLDASLSAMTEGEPAVAPQLPPEEAEPPRRKRVEKRVAFQTPLERHPRGAEDLKRPGVRQKNSSGAARRPSRAVRASEQGLASQRLRVSPAEQAPSLGSRLATDDLVEAVTQRVLQRIGDEIVRKAVTDAVTEVTERIRRKETKRIKKAAD